MTKMYKLFKEACSDADKQPVSDWVYRRVFNEDFNLANTTRKTYCAMLHIFKQRLHRRGYPDELITKQTTFVRYRDRQMYMLKHQPPHLVTNPPLFKCVLPPQFSQLKQIVLQKYAQFCSPLPTPRFIALRHHSLQNSLVRAKITPTDDQFIDMESLLDTTRTTTHSTAGNLPHTRLHSTTIRPCHSQCCFTCRFHLHPATSFRSTQTGLVYPIRHCFSCHSKNLIYLITCTKCKKQYVGLTTLQLNTRINHHRTNIHTNQNIYLCIHFNFPDHSLKHLQVQPIDCVSSGPNALHELRQLEQFWIKTLRTIEPQGLNNSLGFTAS